jgi:hypothetical protein
VIRASLLVIATFVPVESIAVDVRYAALNPMPRYDR